MTAKFSSDIHSNFYVEQSAALLLIPCQFLKIFTRMNVDFFTVTCTITWPDYL